MRFIGNKENIIERINLQLQKLGISGTSFFDVFSGTTSVAKYYKRKGHKIYSSDLLYFSYVLQRAYLQNNKYPTFKTLLKEIKHKTNNTFFSPLDQVVDYLNKIPPKTGFIAENYTPKNTQHLSQPRMFFSNENGKIIDAIRTEIENWKYKNLITENEYFILLACLIETIPFYANISGVYAAFHKKWDARAIKKMVLRPIEIIVNKHNNRVYNKNSLTLLNQIEADIFYLDPPYNQRQYAPNYHLLETIAKYDNPKIKGVSGMRDYTHQKSNFCNAKSAIEDLKNIIENGKFKHLVLSYNNEGIMSHSDIINLFSIKGKVHFIEFDYARFKSNNNGKNSNKKMIKEQLYILSL